MRFLLALLILCSGVQASARDCETEGLSEHGQGLVAMIQVGVANELLTIDRVQEFVDSMEWKNIFLESIAHLLGPGFVRNFDRIGAHLTDAEHARVKQSLREFVAR